ncbi:acetate/propionate family kinase [Pedobacter cryoconitis]|uniref:Acetate kinase n=1 Tax=Pedobacter cryoconitis TaxID=188932 RepID=A0A327SA12_9SPHI|nr:acetate/propionate family kinase [Pedobacter cryoconitis]RAJ22617.1 acetate kinase [Pedobacter cryoconitis]
MNNTSKKCILTINGGSSSIKYALYEMEGSLNQLLVGEMENIGSSSANLNFINCGGEQQCLIDIKVANHGEAADWLVNWLAKETEFVQIIVIGHRIVQGMNHASPEFITAKLIKELKEISAYDPEHLPAEIKLVEAFKKHFPQLDQVACFDTSFHSAMPSIAKLLPIARKYQAKGIKRYGFHGLSYSYLMEEFEQIAGTEASKGKIIMAHLGSGASLAAVKDGKSMDTSMGFTPASGLTMSTRTGDLDPGVAWYLMKSEKLTPEKFNQLVNHESGLLGISETTADMQELLNMQQHDHRAAEAVELFCYQTIKWIGAFAAVLGGLDTLIFSGGIGEHSPEIRERICKGLQFLGIELDETKNINNETFISMGTDKASVWVIKTNEELMIARSVYKLLSYNIKN